jgi:SAM-dependent methyltransferase
MDPKQHWQRVYTGKPADAMSWHQPTAARSVAMIRRVAPDRGTPIIDVGGGASVLVNELLALGYERLTVLDLAASALDAARARLGTLATRVRWLEADVLTAELPPRGFGVWHDRAVFHFLTAPEDRAAYVRQVRRAVRPGGFVLVATFADDGPERCSGLPVARYSAEALHREFGGEFELIGSERDAHHTPDGAVQSFVYCLCRWTGPRRAGPEPA